MQGNFGKLFEPKAPYHPFSKQVSSNDEPNFEDLMAISKKQVKEDKKIQLIVSILG